MISRITHALPDHAYFGDDFASGLLRGFWEAVSPYWWAILAATLVAGWLANRAWSAFVRWRDGK